MANVFEPKWEEGRPPDGFHSRRARLGAEAGSQRLGASVFELKPGEANFPLHFHLGNEELLVVLLGTPSLRTTEGERELEEGELVAFPVGEEGAHQIVNRTDALVRILIVSEMNSPDIVIRPESNKISAFGRPPGSDPDAGMHDVYFRRDSTQLWDGEEPPPEKPQ